ncbi:hypothetical protein (nucleomorph) [Guillardia theta]|uniref:Uncharacterized protein n=1 Tax=Guillardia theta TaxID=55529 RepID=Q98S68_GUITH|nr:hypothetical protein GTHECHR3069 [Guillardia theta]AAK39713.1 hypothetical protein [Guillardia theta]
MRAKFILLYIILFKYMDPIFLIILISISNLCFNNFNINEYFIDEYFYKYESIKKRQKAMLYFYKLILNYKKLNINFYLKFGGNFINFSKWNKKNVLFRLEKGFKILKTNLIKQNFVINLEDKFLCNSLNKIVKKVILKTNEKLYNLYYSKNKINVNSF